MNRLLLAVVCAALAAGPPAAGSTDRAAPPPQVRIAPVRTEAPGTEAGRMSRAAAYDTNFLAVFTFDQGGMCVTEGWTSLDRTAQTHSFWHVAGASELDGGSFGGLLPLEGAQSMWCGAAGPVSAAEDRVLCGYAALPGYGNYWDQSLRLKDCLSGVGGVVIEATVRWDSEPGYDATTLEIDHCDDDWTDADWIELYGGLGTWDGYGTDTLSIAIPDSLHAGDLRIRFRFRSDGVWSDQDGIWNTDGAFLVDRLRVRDTSGVVVPYEDFEDELPGAVEADDWRSYPAEAYGDYAGLFPGYAMLQEDPCLRRSGCMWAFVQGSEHNYGCGGYPDQTTVPYVNENDRYIRNHVVSPDIAVAGAGSRWELRFDVYRDLDLDALVFYEWFVRPVDAQGCPGPWQNDGFVYYGGWKDWYTAIHGVGQYIDAGATHVNVSLGTRDMCEYWCGYYGMGHCHSHAPLFDNVSLYRIDHSGPVWSGRDIDMFQDNFPGDGTLAGTARADMARDILPGASPGIQPGDSVAITVSDPDAGLGFRVPGDTSSGAAVYLYCSIDGPHSGATGGDLVVDTRYNYIGTVGAGGRTWYQIQMDSTWTAAGALVAGRYNVDLNDNLFVPGDTVWFFFGAASTGGKSTYWALPLPTPANETDDIEEAAANPDEFTILPAQALHGYGEWLYVDGMNFRGAQPFFDTAFEQLTILDEMDRYDIRGPSSAVGNHPGSRVTSFFQLAGEYKTIVWNTGDLSTAFGDGSGYPDKSDDTGLLLGFLENKHGLMGGVYLCGDDVADAWTNTLTSASATSLRTKYIDFSLVANNHVPTVGVTPLGVGEPGSMFRDALGPDTVVVYGGCPVINDFDIVAPVGPTVVEMQYHGGGNTAGAIVSDTTTNPYGNTVGFVLSGFSFHNIRDHATGPVMDRAVHMHRILSWIGSLPVIPVPVGPQRVARDELAQNYPNPFNPATTIRYQVRNTGPVTLKVYNVAGQRVRTLMDGTVRAGEVNEVRWRGLNDAGGPVASGVYFYRLVAGDFVETRKMVLLK